MAEPLQTPLPRPVAATAGATRIAGLYALISAVWILASDRLVQALAPNADWMTGLSILKGWVFVAVTAAMLFLMVKRLVAGVASREAQLHTLIHTIPDLVWLKDPDGVYLACNRAFERFFGAREPDILGKTDHDFVSKELADFFRQKDREAVEAGGPRVNEEWVAMADTGERVLLETLKTPMYDAAGTLVGVLGIGRDITAQDSHTRERARLEAQLHQAQKMETVGRFAGGVAHDYNNMLGVILANADLALFQMAEDRSERKYLEEIIKAARHSAELTAQMLAFARRQPVHPKTVDLNRAMEDLLGVLGRLAGDRVELAWKPGQELWPARVDPTQLDQVVTNLVVNARDAIQGSGRIELETRNTVLTAADCEALGEPGPGEYVALHVTDSGCGMEPELLAHIFEPFFTTKPSGKGTGLGLALVQSVVKQNQGLLLVESAPGEGSAFRVLLPRSRSEVLVEVPQP
ncbi:MAG TPA: ATP-binding protein [Geothrix sp.]|jgi:PAS domain S-box-containing protein